MLKILSYNIRKGGTGGVGLLTVAMLMKNTVEAAKMRRKIN